MCVLLTLRSDSPVLYIREVPGWTTCAGQRLSRRPCLALSRVWNVTSHAQKPDFVFLRETDRVHLNRPVGASVQSTAGCAISGSNVGYTVFRGSVKGTSYTLHSPVSPFTAPPVSHRVPSHFSCTVPAFRAVMSLYCYRSPCCAMWQSHCVGFDTDSYVQ